MLPLPDWIPWWGQLLILVMGILFGLAFLMMPFAVFGLKGRLDTLEAQLDDLHAELRMVAIRLPDPDRAPARSAAAAVVVEPVQPVRPRRPPAVDEWSQDSSTDDDGPGRVMRARPMREPDRSEPKLRWPPPPR